MTQNVTMAAFAATHSLAGAELVFWRCLGRAEPAVVARYAGLSGREVLPEGKGMRGGAVAA